MLAALLNALRTRLGRISLGLLLMVLLSVISYLALAPHPPHVGDTGWDKLNHFLAFGTLTALSIACAHKPMWRWCGLPLMWLAYGGLIEILQSFEPTRSAEWGDLLADSIGICIGMLVAASARWLLLRLLTAAQRKR
jgi:VanZ family protein